MAVTKTLRTSVAAATSNSAAGTTTGTAFDLTDKLGAFATAKITNGGTGPTVACSAFLETSGDNTNWKILQQFTAGVTASAVQEFRALIDASIMYARWRFTGNTGQAVTCEGFFQELTSL